MIWKAIAITAIWAFPHLVGIAYGLRKFSYGITTIAWLGTMGFQTLATAIVVIL